MEVPEHLRNVHVKAVGKEEADDYKYPHDFDDHYTDQQYIPVSKTYYKPSNQGYEDTIAKRMAWWEDLRKKSERERKG